MSMTMLNIPPQIYWIILDLKLSVYSVLQHLSLSPFFFLHLSLSFLSLHRRRTHRKRRLSKLSSYTIPCQKSEHKCFNLPLSLSLLLSRSLSHYSHLFLSCSLSLSVSISFLFLFIIVHSFQLYQVLAGVCQYRGRSTVSITINIWALQNFYNFNEIL